MSPVAACYLPVDRGDAVFCEVTGSDPPLVLTHDGFLHRESWDAQFESLSRSRRVVRSDRRGYGRSDEPTAVTCPTSRRLPSSTLPPWLPYRYTVMATLPLAWPVSR